jgi:hypothetical protein
VSRKDRPATPRPLAAETAERIAKIIEAAERAAAGVIDEAEAQARQRLEQAESEAGSIFAARLASISELADSLISHAEAMGRQSEQLLASLDELQRGVPDVEGPDRPAVVVRDEGTSPGSAARSSHLSAVVPVDEEEAETDDGAGASESAGSSAAGARLLATQMAVSGSSREEIAKRLRNGFEIEDTAPILDAILGPED